MRSNQSLSAHGVVCCCYLVVGGGVCDNSIIAIMAASKYSGISLRHLVDECLVAIRLEQHLRVSELNLEIARFLIDSYEEELAASGEIRQTERMILEKLCGQLRKQSELAAIYEQVCEFVRIQVG